MTVRTRVGRVSVVAESVEDAFDGIRCVFARREVEAAIDVRDVLRAARTITVEDYEVLRDSA